MALRGKNILQETRNDVKVLVVEDNLLNQKLLAFMIRESGYQCDVCSNGREAIEALKENVYDLVFMDVEMPEMNGYDTTACIRNVLKIQVPVIITTAHREEDRKRQHICPGVTEYMEKPVTQEKLQQLMAQHVFHLPLEHIDDK